MSPRCQKCKPRRLCYNICQQCDKKNKNILLTMVDLNLYEFKVNRIKRYARENGVSEEEIEEIFKKCFHQLENKRLGIMNIIFTIGKMLLMLFLLTIFFGIVLYNHPATHNLVLRNMQHFIYPGLTIFRTIAVPVITKYPSLTSLYDESCLIENPYFRVTDMDCWPCNSIISVPDLTGQNITRNFNIGIPFTRLEDNRHLSFNDLYNLYSQEESTFESDAKKIFSNNLSYRTLQNVMENRLDINPSLNRDVHVTWRITRLNSGRLLRKLFSRPSAIPDWWDQSTERFVLIDEPKAQLYTLPNPECSNVVIQCTFGAKIIRMEPSPECLQHCRVVTVILSAGQSLWYNWWYWRPVSLPATNETNVSINYLTSYC